MIAFLLAFLGCSPAPDTGPTLDTGWFSAPPDPDCGDRITRIEPPDGAEDWYWRASPVLTVSSDDPAAYGAVLTDAFGDVVPTTPIWSGTQGILALDRPLAPDTDHRLRIVDCLGPREVAFRTSGYGAPLSVAPAELTGRAYVFDVAGARWEEPPGVGALMGLYFTDPLLIGVEWSNPDLVDLLGAQAVRDGDGAVRQWMAEPTWDFPVADFSEAPYFEAVAPRIRIAFGGVGLVVYDLVLSATFSSDGERLGGGSLRGLGDTRELGPALNQGDEPGAACALIAGFGVSCGPCPDGAPYCVPVHVRDAVGTWVPGLRVVRRD